MNVNVKLFQERTPLLIACTSGSLECVQYLIEKGAQINLHCHDTTALMAACEGIGDSQSVLRLVQFLVENNAEVNHQGHRDRTALMMAVSKGRVEVVEYLVNHHADLELPDRNNWTAIFYAVDCNHMDILKILLAKGAATDLEDKKGYKLLQVAEMKGFQDIIDLLPKPTKKYQVPSKYFGYSDFWEMIPEMVGEK